VHLLVSEQYILLSMFKKVPLPARNCRCRRK